MPYCNRVNPFGDIHSDPARGLFTGNRGVIHDPDSRTLLKRRWTTKTWIVCALEHPRGTRREVMGRNFPAMSAVQVAGLVEDDAKVEIEVTAVIPD